MTKEDLKSYRLLEMEVQSLQDRIDCLEHIAPTVEQDIVQASNPEYPYQRISVPIEGVSIVKDVRKRKRIRRLKDKLKNQKREAEELRIEIEEFIARIPDRSLRQAFTELYINGLTQKEVGKLLGMERSTVSKKVDDYLQLSHKSHF